MVRVAVLVGSLGEDSYNRRVTDALVHLAPPDVSFDHSRLDDFPPYNQDHDGNQPAPVKPLKRRSRRLTEYCSSRPNITASYPVFLRTRSITRRDLTRKNAWAGKPASIIGVPVAAVGTATAQQHLRNILAYLDMPTLSQPEVFLQWKEDLIDEAGEIGPDSRDFMQSWTDRFLDWVRLLHAKR